MAIYNDKMQALAVMQHHLGRRSDGAADNCTPSILKQLDKKTQNLVSDRDDLLLKIIHIGTNDEKANFRCFCRQVDVRSELWSIEKQIYRCHALKYIVENVDTWQLLLMPGRTNENERRARQQLCGARYVWIDCLVES